MFMTLVRYKRHGQKNHGGGTRRKGMYLNNFDCNAVIVGSNKGVGSTHRCKVNTASTPNRLGIGG